MVYSNTSEKYPRHTVKCWGKCHCANKGFKSIPVRLFQINNLDVSSCHIDPPRVFCMIVSHSNSLCHKAWQWQRHCQLQNHTYSGEQKKQDLTGKHSITICMWKPFHHGVLATWNSCFDFRHSIVIKHEEFFLSKSPFLCVHLVWPIVPVLGTVISAPVISHPEISKLALRKFLTKRSHDVASLGKW